MSHHAKYLTSFIATALCLIVAVMGLKNIAATRSADGVFGVGFLFGGAILGCIVGIIFYYYRGRRFDTKDQQQIAVETLAKLGEQRRNDGRKL